MFSLVVLICPSINETIFTYFIFYLKQVFLSDQDNKPLSTRDSQVNVTVTMYYKTTEIEPEPLPLLAEDIGFGKTIYTLFKITGV